MRKPVPKGMGHQELRERPPETWEGDGSQGQYSFDLGAHYGPRYDVVAYALRTVTVDEPRSVRILAGGDDGVRAWLNGELVVDASGIHVVPPDGASGEGQLIAGENTLH